MQFPAIDPVAFHVFTWPVHWYGLMYLVGFMGAWLVLSLRIKYSSRGFTQDQLSDLIFLCGDWRDIGRPYWLCFLL